MDTKKDPPLQNSPGGTHGGSAGRRNADRNALSSSSARQQASAGLQGDTAVDNRPRKEDEEEEEKEENEEEEEAHTCGEHINSPPRCIITIYTHLFMYQFIFTTKYNITNIRLNR